MNTEQLLKYFNTYHDSIIQKYILSKISDRYGSYDIFVIGLKPDSLDMYPSIVWKQQITKQVLDNSIVVIKLEDRQLEVYSNAVERLIDLRTTDPAPGVLIEDSWSGRFGWLISFPETILLMAKIMNNIYFTTKIITPILNNIMTCCLLNRDLIKPSSVKQNDSPQISSLMAILVALKRYEGSSEIITDLDIKKMEVKFVED